MFQHMINYLKNRVTNRHNSTLLSSPGCKPSVLGRKISLFGMAGCPGGLIQGSAKPSVAFWCCTTFSFAGAFVIARTHPCPRCQMLCGRELFHIIANFGYKILGGTLFNTRYGVLQLHRFLQRAHDVLYSTIQSFDQSFKVFPLLKQRPQHKTMMLCHPAIKGK